MNGDGALNPQRLGRAKELILYSVVGIVLSIVSFATVSFVVKHSSAPPDVLLVVPNVLILTVGAISICFLILGGVLYIRAAVYENSPNSGLVSISRLSRWATAVAIRLLPASKQMLYREQFEAELRELGEGKHPRRAQAAYALRVLLRAPLLRWALRRTRPKRKRR